MAQGICSIDGCGGPVVARAWCGKHYARWRRRGDPLEVFTAPPECRVCGTPKERNAKGDLLCRECAKRKASEWREGLGADEYRKRARARYDAERDLRRARQRAAWPRYRERAAVTRLAWQRANREHTRKATREWEARNSDQGNERTARRRARAHAAICKHGASCVTAKGLRMIQALPCYYCGTAAGQADHYIPLARGGKHCRKNLVPACADCNRVKHVTIPAGWPGMLLNGYGIPVRTRRETLSKESV